MPDYKQCEIFECYGKHYAKGFCENHYRRFKKHGTIEKQKTGKLLYGFMSECSDPECKRKPIANDMCRKHYQRWYRQTHGQ